MSCPATSKFQSTRPARGATIKKGRKAANQEKENENDDD